MKSFNLQFARQIYKRGDNVSEYLRRQFNEKNNTPYIIEIVYDLQAGTYIKFANSNAKKLKLYIKEISKILNYYVPNNGSLLDVGTGELTILTHLLNSLEKTPSKVIAFDLSWSRLIKGKKYISKNLKNKKTKLDIFCANIENIPLYSKCVDTIISNHALEPNGKNLPYLLKELFRVAKKKIILFEPAYELADHKGKKRMNKLGYIKNISLNIKKLGAKLIDYVPIKNTFNHHNPTVCYVIEPPPQKNIKNQKKIIYTVPGTNFLLKKKSGFYVCDKVGLAFPIFKKIPFLRDESSLVVSAITK